MQTVLQLFRGLNIDLQDVPGAEGTYYVYKDTISKKQKLFDKARAAFTKLNCKMFVDYNTSRIYAMQPSWAGETIKHSGATIPIPSSKVLAVMRKEPNPGWGIFITIPFNQEIELPVGQAEYIDIVEVMSNTLHAVRTLLVHFRLNGVPPSAHNVETTLEMVDKTLVKTARARRALRFGNKKRRYLPSEAYNLPVKSDQQTKGSV